MPPLPQDSSPVVKMNPRQQLFWAGLVVLLLTGLASVGYWVVRTYLPAPQKTIYREPQPFEPTGTLYLTLAPEGGATGVYAFAIEQQVLSRVLSQDGAVAMTMRTKALPDGRSLVATDLDPQNPTKALGAMQIYAMSANGALEKLSNTATVAKRHPSYSIASQVVVYEGQRAGGAPEDSSVYALVAPDRGHEITTGAMPALTPDGAYVVVLRSDGLYKVPVSTTATSTSGERVWPVSGGRVGKNSQFSISPKGNYLAWSFPDEGNILVMQVLSWQPFFGEVKQTIHAHAFWPVFSPDEHYLAYEEVDGSGTTMSGARLTIFDLRSPQQKVVKDLSSFVQTKLFISDWK